MVAPLSAFQFQRDPGCMLTRPPIRDCKRFEETDFKHGKTVVFIGSKISDKTVVITIVAVEAVPPAGKVEQCSCRTQGCRIPGRQL